jgi:hypothetical protein
MDSEDLREVISAYQKCVAGNVVDIPSTSGSPTIYFQHT